MTITLKQLNEMSKEQFAEALGSIFEHSPWVAEAAHGSGPFASVEELHSRMVEAAKNAPEEKVLALLRSHPDLATRLAMTDYSVSEQKGAGLDQLSPEEFETFSSLNREYVGKFGFPFILAVRGKNKDDILASLRQRIHYDRAQEWNEALAQIARITGFRLADLVQA
ncbi:2-oxo-4-hydroxy-4-carboxy-5-ureidoimidazoline decarboxylase [Paenibacillus beijingensis]|uniref:2-oxo-4-hydroxy-4-carboxy-5-ureidoimidazoline decarboxylase n=1 Tax=Paenibacillus beijingensis TaxID=1126833 RepID=UPI000AD26769|nr:2-oxo-4-hydroxy-4-carboxy-5-ureidoimidazoline decarboxylase [Paenibacillus beijingensis]